MESSDPLRASNLVNGAISMSVVDGDAQSEALACFALAEIQLRQGFLQAAENNYLKCIWLATVKAGNNSMGDLPAGGDIWLFNAYLKLALCEERMNKLAEAALSAEKCSGLNFSSVPATEKRRAIRVLSRIRARLGETDTALRMLKDLLDQERAEKNLKGEALTLFEQAGVYRLRGEREKAKESYLSAKKIADSNQLNAVSAEVNDALASLYHELGDTENEMSLRRDNLLVSERMGDHKAVAMQNIAIGNLYLSDNNLSSAEEYFDLGMFDNGSQYDPEAGSSIGDTTSTPPQTDLKAYRFHSEELQLGADGFRKIAERYLANKNMEKALDYYKRYAQMQDSVQSTHKKELEDAIALSTSMGQNEQRILMLEKERDLSDQSIQLLQQDKKFKTQQLVNRNLVIGGLGVGILILVVAGIFLLRTAAARRKADKLLALQSLSGQMNPHFIFNALNSVNEYISRNDERAANRYLSSFSKLMRQVMDVSRHTFIPLQEELEMLQLYLQLEQARFRDQFEYTFEVSPEVHNSEFEVPPMIVQPYLENAVWHGLRYRETKGHLWVSFMLEAGNLKITIRDNGIGVKKSREIKTRSQKKQNSLGMRNIETRVNLLNEIYHTDIRISVSETYPGQEEAGVTVNILIPRKTGSAEQ